MLARLFRTASAELGVTGYPKTTGRHGIQVWIPLELGRYTFTETSRWVERVPGHRQSVPELVSWEWSRDGRDGRARLDYTQNAPIKTLVAPYAVRPAPGGPVSTPIAWAELDDPGLQPDGWTIRSLPERVERLGGPLRGSPGRGQPPPPL